MGIVTLHENRRTRRRNKEENKMADTFGEAFKNYLSGDRSPYIIRRDDGFVETRDVGIYFTKYPEWQEYEKEVLRYVQRRVLDLGAGAGRYALYLQEKGNEVHAIDISPGAVEVMKQIGVKNVYLMDLRKLDFPDNYFDSILMMFNYSSLAGTIEGTKNFLKVLCRISTPKGRIIITNRDPRQTDKPEYLAYQERNRRLGKPIGLTKIRIEYNGEDGDWFELSLVSSDELEDLVKDTGWKILKIAEGKEGNYGVVLEKS